MALQEEINDLIEIFKEEGLTQEESLNFARPLVMTRIQADPESELKLHSLADIQKAIVDRWAEIDEDAAREDAIRMDKPCGKGFIAENKECHKTPQTGEAKSASKSAGSNNTSSEKKLKSKINGRLETFTDENGNKRWLITPLSVADQYYTPSSGTAGPLETDRGSLDPIQSIVKGVSLDINQSLLLPAKGGGGDSVEKEIEWTKAIIHKALPVGGTVFVRADEELGVSEEKAKGIAENLGLQRMGFVNMSGDPRANTAAYVGLYRNGKIERPTQNDIDSVEKIRELRSDQTRAMYRQSNALLAVTTKSLKKEAARKAILLENDAASQLALTEDQYLGRKPTSIPPIAEYKKKAEDWAKSQFGEVLQGANGFTLEQTLAHDVAHPIVHEMLGLDSSGISKRFKSAKQNDGKDSLVLEEAIVNVAEHLSRGDSIEASILNGMRLARVLSRNKKVQSDEVRKQVRSKEFNAELVKMSYDIYYHNNFSLYMKYVRETNRISGTVQQAGDDFTNTASGG